MSSKQVKIVKELFLISTLEQSNLMNKSPHYQTTKAYRSSTRNKQFYTCVEKCEKYRVYDFVAERKTKTQGNLLFS
jgi:hypothetical protein